MDDILNQMRESSNNLEKSLSKLFERIPNDAKIKIPNELKDIDSIFKALKENDFDSLNKLNNKYAS